MNIRQRNWNMKSFMFLARGILGVDCMDVRRFYR